MHGAHVHIVDIPTSMSVKWVQNVLPLTASIILYRATHTGDNGLELDGVPHTVGKVWERCGKVFGCDR